jgi:hypothetical protein
VEPNCLSLRPTLLAGSGHRSAAALVTQICWLLGLLQQPPCVLLLVLQGHRRVHQTACQAAESQPSFEGRRKWEQSWEGCLDVLVYCAV